LKEVGSETGCVVQVHVEWSPVVLVVQNLCITLPSVRIVRVKVKEVVMS